MALVFASFFWSNFWETFQPENAIVTIHADVEVLPLFDVKVGL
jgi:hypothetical protein